jgi:hypothetical protein
MQKSPAGKFNHDFLLEISPIGAPDARAEPLQTCYSHSVILALGKRLRN